jgi:hypothetical protein
MECWGWSGNTLTYLGYLKQTIDKGPVKLIGIDFDLIGKLGIYGPLTFPFTTNPHIAPPDSVRFFRDFNDCISHIPSGVHPDACNYVKEGYLILTWEWTPYGFPPRLNYNVKDIRGFRVYKTTLSGESKWVYDTNDDHEWKIAIINPTGGGPTYTPQYFVHATTKGIDESDDSNRVSETSPKNTVTLHPRLWDGGIVSTEYEGFFCELDGGPAHYFEIPNPTRFLEVGYDYRHSEDDFCDRWDDKLMDGHVVFDLTQIKGQVTSAILRWENAEGMCSHGGCTLVSKGCWIPLVDQNAAIIANYPLGNEYDVTTQVRAWVQGLPNKGFALLSGDRVMGHYKGEACVKRFENFTLEVTYSK